MKHKKKKDRLTIIMITLLIIGGIGLISYQYVINFVVAPYQLEKAYKNSLSPDEIKRNLERLQGKGDSDSMFDYDSVETLEVMDINPVINRENVIGGVYVPSVGINLPIMYGVSHNILLTSIGTMKPNQQMGEGNYVLIGHNSYNPNILFAPIRNISKGDSIYVTDKNKVYEYSMVDSEVVEPSRGDVMDDVEGKQLVSLISCFSADGSDRIVVRGELKNIHDYSKASSDILKAFNDL